MNRMIKFISHVPADFAVVVAVIAAAVFAAFVNIFGWQ